MNKPKKRNNTLPTVEDGATRKANALGLTFGELLKLDLPPAEEILHCLPRRKVATLNAITNGHKTTLGRNLLINLAVGKPFPPILPGGRPRKVAVLDFEDTLESLKPDLITISSSLTREEKYLLNENVLIICDEDMGDDIELNHFDAILARLLAFNPDLIFIETVSAAFTLDNENNNAEIRSEVFSRLKPLAKKTNAAVLVTHHVGKSRQENGSTRNGSHKGRGGSSFGDQSWLIMNLEASQATGNVILQCGKSKGVPFPDTEFRHDPATRLLTIVGELSKRSELTVLVDKLEFDRDYSAKQLNILLKEFGADRTIKRKIVAACESGILSKRSHGIYRKVSKGPTAIDMTQ
mgnify:FL=1